MSKSIKKGSVGGSYVGKMYRKSEKLKKHLQTKKIKSEDKGTLKKVVLDLDGDVGFKPFKYRCRCERHWSYFGKCNPFFRFYNNRTDIEEIEDYKKFLRR